MRSFKWRMLSAVTVPVPDGGTGVVRVCSMRSGERAAKLQRKDLPWGAIPMPFRRLKRVNHGGTFGRMSEPLTLQRTIAHVRDFHDAFRIANAETPTGSIGERETLLRYTLMREENEEYLEAANKGDLVEVADALGDMLYILCGTILKHGLQHKIEEVFLEIQRSNMSKLDDNGRPIYREDGKVMKSARYFKPDIAAVLER